MDDVKHEGWPALMVSLYRSMSDRARTRTSMRDLDAMCRSLIVEGRVHYHGTCGDCALSEERSLPIKGVVCMFCRFRDETTEPDDYCKRWTEREAD